MAEEATTFSEPAARDVTLAVRRSTFGKCPACGNGKLYRKYLKVADNCSACGEELHHHRADDFPAYIVVVIVGHVVLGGFMAFEASSTLSTWQHLAIWAPLTVIMAVGLLKPVKGAIVGLQWALYMHGFGGEDDLLETHPEM